MYACVIQIGDNPQGDIEAILDVEVCCFSVCIKRVNDAFLARRLAGVGQIGCLIVGKSEWRDIESDELIDKHGAVKSIDRVDGYLIPIPSDGDQPIEYRILYTLLFGV